jgi:hypothetical protein
MNVRVGAKVGEGKVFILPSSTKNEIIFTTTQSISALLLHFLSFEINSGKLLANNERKRRRRALRRDSLIMNVFFPHHKTLEEHAICST